MPSVARLLLADADVRRADRLCKPLGAQGFHLNLLHDGALLPQQLSAADVDALILHADLPPTTALEITRDLRDQGITLPILILNDTSHYGERVAVLQAGADDVLSSPYALEELIARLYALLRRARMGRNELAGSFLSYGDLVVDTDARHVSRAGQPVKLSVKEYDLLLCLMRHQQQILPRQRLLSRHRLRQRRHHRCRLGRPR